jgi:TRAP-type C4-dicarboxylate transport system substrate-binding protein
VFVNEKAFAALDKPSQDALLKAAGEAETRGWRVSEEKTKWYLEQLAKNGMTVAPPSPPFAAELKKIGDTMTAEWTKQAGQDGQAVVDAYKKM